MKAASSRSRLTLPSASAGCLPNHDHGEGCRIRFRIGCASRPMSRSCLVPTRSWSRPSRADRSITSSAIRSRGGLPIRASACCSRGGSNAAPLGFVANEYTLAIWALNDMGEMVKTGRLDLAKLFDEDMLGDDLDAWLAESSLMKRSFRVCAIISGLIERRHPGQEKTGRQMTVSSDLIYDVIRQHEPDHVLLRAAFAEAATGLIDVGRLTQFLQRISGRIRHIALGQVSPLAVPVMLEIGRESVPGDAGESLLRETVEELIAEALSGHAERKA